MRMELTEQMNELVMKLLHYFITEKEYSPIILHGAQNEIWLENLNGDYEIVRIVTDYIHNDEQLEYDLLKTKQIAKKIKHKTFSFSMNVMSIFLNLGDNVHIQEEEKFGNISCVRLKEIEDLRKQHMLLEVFPDIMKETNFKEEGMELFIKITTEISKKNEKTAREAEDLFKSKKPVVTTILIIINIVLFLAMYVFGRGSTNTLTLYQFGAFSKGAILNGEYFRLITSAFLHIGIIHLLCNMYSLYVLGPQLEGFFGKTKFLIIYLFSAISGNLLSMVFPGNGGLSAGASGAIFGLLAALTYFGYHYRVYLGTVMRSQIIPLILLNLMIGFISPGINNAAHIGGLIGGFLITMALGVAYKSTTSEKTNGWILTIIYTCFLIYMGFIGM